MKKYITGFVLGSALMVSGSVALASIFVGGFSPNGEKLTPAEEIQLGHTYSVYDGHKLEVQKEVLTDEEKRFRAIEARLSALEAKN